MGVYNMKVLTHRHQVTIAEGIARVSIRTGASWDMVDYSTQGIKTTGSRTGVSTFFSDASFIAGAIRIN